MADHIPGGPVGEDPLGDRLRATFAAERDDIERRHLAPTSTSTRTRPLMWIPFAAAAAVLAVAGFLFIGNRSDDAAIDLGVAGQTEQGDWEVPNPDVPGSDQDATNQSTLDPTPVPTPNLDATTVQALPVPSGDLSVPHIAGDNMCGEQYNPDLVVVWTSSGESAIVQTAPEPTGELFVSRAISPGQQVALAGGCTVGTTQLGLQMWYEIQGQPGQATEWMNVANLATVADYQAWISNGTPPPPPFTPDVLDGQFAPAPSFPGPTSPQFDGCDANLVFPPRLVVGIQANDPDGGLVAHSGPGLDEPVTRILQLDQVVFGTGVCTVDNDGIPWFQLQAPGTADWASARFLATPGPACLSGEQYGSRDRIANRLIYNVQPGDTIDAITGRFDIPLEELLGENPSLDPQSLRVDQAIWIPGALGQPEQIFGPIDGLAVVDGDRIAFAEPEQDHYRWYDAGTIQVGASCFTNGAPWIGCASGPIRLIDLQSPEPTWTGQGPLQLTVTGRNLAAANTADMMEVTIEIDQGVFRTGMIDPNEAGLLEGTCNQLNPDSFAQVPCNAEDSTVQVGTTERGSTESTADHVHLVSVENGLGTSGPCTRFVIEFGSGTHSSTPHIQAERLPPMTIEKQLQSTHIRLPQEFGLTFDDVDTRLAVNGALLLLARDSEFRPTIEVLYDQPGLVNVWFLENPARVIVDYVSPPQLPENVAIGPFGGSFVLRQPIQSDLTSRGLTAGARPVVQGYGRPFEAFGAYRIYPVEPNTDPFAFFENPPGPLVEDFFMTSGWTDGWGSFEVQLPRLDPGTYIAVFGESPPSDQFDFIGAGQMFRIADPDDPTTNDYPPALLLSQIEIPL